MTKRTPNFERLLAWVPIPIEGSPQESAYRATPDEADDGGKLTREETDAVVALAHLMATSDESVSDDESHAFYTLLAYLAGGDPEEQRRLEALAARLDDARGTIEDRARRAAAALRRPSAKARGYKAAYTVRVWDLEASPEEDELDDLLVEALGLRDEDAAELAQQVNEALMIG